MKLYYMTWDSEEEIDDPAGKKITRKVGTKIMDVEEMVTNKELKDLLPDILGKTSNYVLKSPDIIRP